MSFCFVNIKYLAANFIFKYISEGKFLDYSTLQGVDAEIIEVEVKPESSVLGKQLKDLNFPEEQLILALFFAFPKEGFRYQN